MKKNIIQIITVLVLSLLSVGTFAQDRRTLDTKVADLLAQFPTSDLDYRDRLLNEMVQLGPEGFQKIANQLTSPGEGDDTAPRMAINGIARYASELGKENVRDYAETSIIKALENQSDKDIKAFLIHQLNLIGGDKSVAAVKKYLTDDLLSEPATQMLLDARGPQAAQALLDALPKVEGKPQLTIVKALGELHCKRSVSLITPLIDDKNPKLQKVTLAALASIGDPASYKTLYNAAKTKNFAYDATNAAEAFVNYTARLAEENETDLSKKACKAIFKANQSDDLLHNYSKALAIYTQYFGYEAMPLLLKAVDNSNKAFRYSALNLAVNLGGVAATREWIAKAKAVHPEVKAEIIYMLGQKGDPLAINFVKENLDASNQDVREESITALLKLQARDATPELIDHLSEGKDIEAVKTALLQLLDEKHLAPVAAKLGQTSGKVKAALVDLLAAKSGKTYFDEILGLTNSSDSNVRIAAFSALKRVSTKDDLDKLIMLLLSALNDNQISQVQLAVVAAAQGVDDEKTENGKVLNALKSTDDKERIITILPEIGGSVALQTVTDFFNNSTGKTKQAAFEALTNWKDYSASAALFDICKSSSGEFREKAFANYLRQVSSANLPDDEKLLQYRKVMPYAQTNEEKTEVINAIGNLNTFLSMIYLKPFLDKNSLQQVTARAIMKIAMPDSEGNGGFSGDIVRNLLERVASVISGEESEYDKINIKNYLAKMPGGKGFVSMFNGENLDGWQGMLLNGNPIKIAKLSDKERTKLQVEANKKMFENWSVRDEQIVFNGHGANLVSVKKYKDFELIVDWKITKKGDSGIYLRGTPQVQIWDTSRVEVGAQVGSGGLYNNNKDNIRDPLKVADNPINEWNTFRITMIGNNVTVYLNGELVVDNVRMDNYWDRSIPMFESGTIELQAHGNELAFRDIYVREINTKHIGLTDEEIDDDFVSLFNGRNLDGWQGNKTDYYAQDGEMVVNPERGGHGNIYTDKEYSDFIFRFDFQLTPGANNGLGIRAPLQGDAAYAGMELQILDNTAPIYANLHKYQYHGSVYGVIPAKRGYLKPVGQWNSEEVIVKGTHVTVILNGTTILDGDIKEASKNGTLDGKNHPGLKREKGYIGFLGHGAKLKFRDIRIKDLSK